MKRVTGESGYVLVVVALALPVILGVLGLAIDVGHLRYVKWRMQAAADAAAVAGAHEILFGTWQAAACADAVRNGYSCSVPGISVTVNRPPTQGPCSLNPNIKNFCVEVIITQPAVPTFFMKIFGVNYASVSARAVGILWSGPNCIYALDTGNTQGALKLTPDDASYNYALDAQCGIAVNSSNTDAFHVGDYKSVTAKSIGVNGGYTTGNSTVTVTDPPYQVVTGMLPVTDPLAYLTPPTIGSCNGLTPNITTGSVTLNPGVYCNGITIDASNLSKPMPNVTFNPGTYILKGPFTVTSANSEVSTQHANLFGNGVFFYLAAGGQANFQRGKGRWANVSFTAQTTGSYAGILFYQDRANTTSATLSSGDGAGFEGALYFPSAFLEYSNSRPTTANYLILVAKTLAFYRDTAKIQHVNYDTSGLPGGSPIKRAVLTE